MKLFLGILLTIFSISAKAQRETKLEELKDHVGDSVETRGKVFGIRYLENAKNTPTFINVGGVYPNQLLTVVIWGDVRNKLGYKPEEKFKNGNINVIGKVELFKDKPQIVIKNPNQIVLLIDEEVPADKIPPIEKKKDNQ